MVTLYGSCKARHSHMFTGKADTSFKLPYPPSVVFKNSNVDDIATRTSYTKLLCAHTLTHSLNANDNINAINDLLLVIPATP